MISKEERRHANELADHIEKDVLPWHIHQLATLKERPTHGDAAAWFVPRLEAYIAEKRRIIFELRANGFV